MMPINQHIIPLQPSGIRYFTALAKQTPGCAMLTIGEPDLDTPAPIREVAIEALQNHETHYAPNQGIPQLLSAIADFETRRGMKCEKDQVLVTVGASGALYTSLTGILNPGDEVIVPTPAFGLYESIIQAAGGKPVFLDTCRHGFQIDAAAFAACVTEKTKAVILNSPNNPTGVILSQDSIDAVKAAVQGKPIWVICDNVYNQFTDETCPDLSLDEEMRDQIILCQSFSKPYAMTGWRVGYLVAPESILDKLLLLHAAQVAAVPTFLQHACITALQTDTAPMAEIFRTRRAYVCRRLREMGLSFPEPKGAFYIFPDISRFGIPSEEFCLRMIREAKVAAVPGICFGAEGYIRISCCYGMEELEKGLDRLENFIRSL